MEDKNFTQKIQWCAIGDSFTYLNDHLDETLYRLHKGYLTRIQEKLPELELLNIGINGSTFDDWVGQPIPEADLYTVLLGTNDWHRPFPMGLRGDFSARTRGTILGNLGILLDHIREASPEALILVANPVERGDFVYLLDPENNAAGSYAPENGLFLKDLAAEILACCASEDIAVLDLNTLSGFTQQSVVRFKRVRSGDHYEDLAYPHFVGIPYDPKEDEYPYPPEAAALTYDGLHPSDEGAQIIADLFADALQKLLYGPDETSDRVRRFREKHRPARPR